MSVEFVGFADDCRIYARLELEGRRLTDILNEAAEVQLTGVLMESLEDGHAVELTELAVTRDDLYAVVGTGGRGAANRRIRTRAHPVEMKLGGYLVSGNIHTRPGSDPLAGVLRRAPMVPSRTRGSTSPGTASRSRANSTRSSSTAITSSGSARWRAG